MPFSGTLDVSAALADAPVMKSLSPATWELPGAELVQISYEVDEAAALAVTPPALHPSIPPYATFSAAHFPSSPHGPFNLAMVRLIARAGIRPRGLLLGAYTDNEAVADGLAEGWGYRIRTAEVTYQRRYESIRGSVEIDGEVALEVRLDDPEPVAPGDLELFDNLHLTKVADADPVIVQVDPTYEYHSADRGRAELATFDPDALGIAGIIPVYRVVAVACKADLALHAPRFVMDPVKPAVEGTKRLQSS
ncbi:MAG: acetoacetate decarboxylase family protein [Acidimicrobiia bacterium]|nr:acetoacetate decarboxylase family protein [Acidimicrobiia bacterium]